MIFKCRFAGEDCGADNFTAVFTDFGICYTFNHNSTAVKKVGQSGSGYGLHLMVNIEQYEYMEGPFNTAGLKILAHAPNTQPRVRDLGFDVPPGMQGLVGIQITQVTNLPTATQSSCGRKELTFLRHIDYSAAACDMECQTDYVRIHCDCHLLYIPRLPQANDSLRYCNQWDQIDCVNHALREFKEQPPQTNNCSCPVACRTKSYVPSLSYAALSRFNAKQILTSQPTKINPLKPHFRQVHEIASRFRHQKHDLQLFGNVSAIQRQMNENGIVADGDILRNRLPTLLAPQCFKYAQGTASALPLSRRFLAGTARRSWSSSSP